MKRICQFLVVVALVATVMLATRYVRHQRARAVALPVIAKLGGKVDSITSPLVGTEYYNSFAGHALTRDEIDKLVVLNALARNGNLVSVSLNDATISVADRKYMQDRLPEVHVQSDDLDARPKPAAK